MSADDVLPTPSLWRRMACFLYEGVLLFGVVMVAGLVWGVATDQRHALIGQHGLQAFVFAVLAWYFVWFWSRRGQTLAMQTWHIRLLTAQGLPVTRLRALCRFLLSWMWFMPALVILGVNGVTGGWPATGTVVAGVLCYAALARLHPSRQFPHDLICSTRLVTWLPQPRGTARAST